MSVGGLAEFPIILAVNASLPVKTVDDLVKLAKTRSLSFASAGTGSAPHMSGELFNIETGSKLVHVPYKGSAGALNDLLGGQVSVSLVPVHVVMPHVNSGRLIALALASSKRNPKGQTIPTFSEFGIDGAEADIWYGFWGPKSLPVSMVKSLNNDLKSILLSSQVKEALEKQGLDVTTSSPEDLQNIVIKEIQNVSRIIDKNKISLN